MERRTVTSGAVRSIGHEGDTLEIEYRNGRVYRYPGVSREVYEKLLTAPSLGRAVQQQILGGGFPHVPVAPEPEPETAA
jgi:hypothetical protein